MLVAFVALLGNGSVHILGIENHEHEGTTLIAGRVRCSTVHSCGMTLTHESRAVVWFLFLNDSRLRIINNS